MPGMASEGMDALTTDGGGMMTDEHELQIHIHEHVGPLRERVSKLEGRMDVHDRELTTLRLGLEQLRDRIDHTRDTVVAAISEHAKASMKMFDEHQKIDLQRDKDISERLGLVQVQHADLMQQIVGLKAWVKAIALGAGLVVAALGLLVKLGVFHHLMN